MKKLSNIIKGLLTFVLSGIIATTSIQIPVLADEQIDEIEMVGANPDQSKINNPRSSNGVVTWDCVYFGNYWQNDTNGDGTADTNDSKEPIKWRVLSVDGKDAFLIADQNLDCQRYNTPFTNVTWKTCTLRSWLNGYGSSENESGTDYSSSGANFIDNAFSSSEKSAIYQSNLINANNPEFGTEGGDKTPDMIFLLSYYDAINNDYGFSTDYIKYDDARFAKNTEYAKAAGARTESGGSYDGNGDWWLRSPGVGSDFAMIVVDRGDVNRYGYDVYESSGVRPALHLNLSSSDWSYAGLMLYHNC